MLEKEERRPKEWERELWVGADKGGRGSLAGSRVVEVASCSDFIARRS